MFDDLPLFAPMPHYVAGCDTSYDAAKSIRSDLSALRRQVLATVQAAPNGITCEGLEAITGLKHQTASARLKELQDLGQIEWRIDPRTGKHHRAINASGRSAKLYYAL
jgi:hypothetical protein